MDTSSYRTVILDRLQHLNRRTSDYQSLFTAYSDLVDKVIALTAQNNRIRKDGNDSPSHQANAVTTLQTELSELYKKKAQNDQQLIETNNRLQAKEKECDEAKQQRDKALNEVIVVKSRNANLEEHNGELNRTNQHLRDEYLALQATYNGLEQKYRQTKEEFEQLIERWTAFKAKEAEFYNEQNDIAQKKREQRLRSEIEEATAAQRNVPTFDDKAFEVVGHISDRTASICIGDVVPTRCALQFEAHEGEVNAVKWSPSGNRFATGGTDRKIKLYELANNKQDLRATFTGSNQALMSLDFDHEESQILGASNDFAVRVWTISDQRCRHSLTGHSGKVFAARFHAEATQVVSGSHDRTLKVWDLRNRRCYKTLFAGSTVHDIVTSEGGPSASIISGHYDKKLRFWDTRSESTAVEVLLAGRVTSLDISLDRLYLLCCTRDDSLCMVDLRTNQVIHTYCAETFRVSCDYSRAVLSPNMEYCAAGSSDGHVFIWNVHTSKIEKILTKGHENPVLACSWHPQGHSLLTVDRSRTVCLWT
uniref:Autophagy-related protein 16 domain-containing protein n=1 Tax=Plectus sambesii TaxID=2011161 RepID=A0A914UKN1_9BILA